jgi:hypothetical protein
LYNSIPFQIPNDDYQTNYGCSPEIYQTKFW